MRLLFLLLISAIGLAGYLWDHPATLKQAITQSRLTEQQITLERYTNASIHIDAVLKRALSQIPTAARIRVAFIHIAPNTLDLLRFDITNAATNTGHPIGELTADHSISEWSAYFSTLLNDQCVDVNSIQTSTISQERLKSLEIRRFLACPIFNNHRQFLGAVFVSWDINDPDPSNMADVEAIVRRAANDIGREKTT